MADRPADWQCPNDSCVNHTKMVFGTKETCPKCGSTPDGGGQKGGGKGGGAFPSAAMSSFGSLAYCDPSGGAGGQRADDWQCPNENCINHTKMVFGRHASCPSCGTAKGAAKPGDWLCPNLNCVNSKNCVFASKAFCPKCHAPKPAVGQRGGNAGQKGGYGAMMPAGKGQMQQMQHMYAQMLQMQSMQSPAFAGSAADWQCPNSGCVNNKRMVFAKNSSCPQCGAPKSSAVATDAGYGRRQAADWQCPNTSCINNQKMVFGKNASCPQCGAPKESVVPTNAGNGRQGQPGDWQCPNTDCMNHHKMVFAKHVTCPQCGCENAGTEGRSSPY